MNYVSKLSKTLGQTVIMFQIHFIIFVVRFFWRCVRFAGSPGVMFSVVVNNTNPGLSFQVCFVPGRCMYVYTVLMLPWAFPPVTFHLQLTPKAFEFRPCPRLTQHLQ